jgi:O-antigen/teichoic acid export membrane protein
MTVLSDGGISTGVMAQGGKVWQDRQKLGAVLATGLDLRRKFAIFSLVVSIPILGYLLLHHGATWVMTVLITASLIPAFYASLSDAILQIPVKLHQAIVPLQRNQVEVGVGRLLLTGITLFAFPWAFVAIIASGIPRIWGNVKLRKIADVTADKEQEPDAEERKKILKIVRKMLPDVIYYAFSGQITMWIISFFGKSSAVAYIGALSRISVILAIFSTLTSVLIVPRFAKLTAQKIIILKRYSQILILYALLMVFIIGFVCLFSEQILWIFGENYLELQFELILTIVNSCILGFSGIAFALSQSKGWVLSPVIAVLSNVLPLITGCFIFDITTLQGVLYLNMLVAIVLMLSHLIFGYYKILRLQK